LSSGSLRRSSTDKGLTGSSSSLAAAAKTSIDTDLVNEVVSVDDDVSQETGSETGSAVTTNGPSATDSESMHCNDTSSGGASHSASKEDNAEGKIKNDLVRLKHCYFNMLVRKNYYECLHPRVVPGALGGCMVGKGVVQLNKAFSHLT
jgi:hypothetical protein